MKTKGVVLTALSGILFGAIPLFTSLLYKDGFDVISVSFYRYFIVLPALLIACKINKVPLRISRHQAFEIFIHIAFLSTATLLFLNYSYIFISTGTATTLHFLYPIFVILMCKIVYRDKIDHKTKQSSILMLAAMACFLDRLEFEQIFGLMLALASALTYAIYLVALEKRKICHMNPLQFSFHLSLYICCLLLIMNIVTASITITLSLNSLFYIVCTAIISLCALIFLQIGTNVLGSKATSLYSLLEPITSVVLGYLILQETIGLSKILGCVLILLAVVNLASDRRSEH